MWLSTLRSIQVKLKRGKFRVSWIHLPRCLEANLGTSLAAGARGWLLSLDPRLGRGVGSSKRQGPLQEQTTTGNHNDLPATIAALSDFFLGSSPPNVSLRLRHRDGANPRIMTQIPSYPINGLSSGGEAIAELLLCCLRAQQLDGGCPNFESVATTKVRARRGALALLHQNRPQTHPLDPDATCSALWYGAN